MILTPQRIAHTRDFSDKMKRLGELCKERRLAAGWTLQDAARKVGCSFQRIHDIEKGDGPSLATYLNLCKVLNKGRSMLEDCPK